MTVAVDTVPLTVTTGPQLLQPFIPPAQRGITAPVATNTPPVDQTAYLDVALIVQMCTAPLTVTTGPQLLQPPTPPAPHAITAPVATNTPPVDQTADLDVALIVGLGVVLIADLDVDRRTNIIFLGETL